MSVKLKIRNTGECFDLPSDYIFESEINNPLFSDRGNQTVSISLPNTEKNRRMTGYAYRVDKTEKPSQRIPIIEDLGFYQQCGVMAINSASRQSTSIGIGWDESEVYQAMKSTLLRDLNNLPVFISGGTSQQSMVQSMLVHLTGVMKSEMQADYFVFPLVLKHDSVSGERDGTPFHDEYYEVLNDIEKVNLDSNNKHLPTFGAMGNLLAMKNQTLNRYIDGNVVPFDVPMGYAVSPFLKVGKIVELIFSHFGFSIKNNPFLEIDQFNKMVVLNNNMDTILTGKLHYRDMMPDITIKEFLDSLYNRFGMQYFVNSNTNTVTLGFLRDILTDSSQTNLTEYLTESMKINYSDQKQLRLMANREIEGTEVKWKSFDEFLKAFDYQFLDVYKDQEWPVNYSSIFNLLSRTYTILDQGNGSREVVSSDFFDWDKKSNLEYEDIQMKDLSVPIELYYKSGSLMNLLHYLIGYKHSYSNMSISGEIVESDQNKNKLAFSFAWGKTSLANMYNFNYFFSSQDNRDDNGRFIINPNTGEKYDISLSIHREDGVFNRFWKEYDAFLRHSNQSVEAKLKLPEEKILRLESSKKIIISNQPFLLEQIRFKQNEINSVSDLKFRTLRLYEPYDLSEEQKVETYYPQKYYWRYVIWKDSKLEEEIEPKRVTKIVGNRPAQERDRKSLTWLPPTEKEYREQSTRRYEYKYDFYYMTGPNEIMYPITCIVTFYPTLI